jgi:hypothetical protein
MSTPLPNEFAKESLMPNTAKDCDCPTMCPKCGADLTGASNAAPMPAMNMPSAMTMPAPAKKGLLGIGFLGLGGRRRRTAHRRRRVTHRRARRNTRRNNRRRAH